MSTKVIQLEGLLPPKYLEAVLPSETRLSVKSPLLRVVPLGKSRVAVHTSEPELILIKKSVMEIIVEIVIAMILFRDDLENLRLNIG